MERDSKDIQMEILITVTLKWERLMAREYIHGAMGKFMMVNGIKGLNMAMEFGEDSTMIPI